MIPTKETRLERIKRLLGSFNGAYDDEIAWLERLEKPSVAMTNAGIRLLERNGIEGNAAELSSLADLCFERMFKAAEEDA